GRARRDAGDRAAGRRRAGRRRAGRRRRRRAIAPCRGTGERQARRRRRRRRDRRSARRPFEPSIGVRRTAMHVLLLIALGLMLFVGPSMWVKSVMARYSAPKNRYPKTGGDVARELLEALSLHHVRIEATDAGDHYDPVEKIVRLSRANFDGRSLTAVTVAAHEVGHALQDAAGFGPLHWRTRLVRWVAPIERVGAGMLLVAPFSVALTRAPMVGLLTFVGGFLTLGSGVVVHALTLPTE